MSPDAIKVLIVDDEEDFVEMLSLRLEAAGLDVAQADSGQACLDHLENHEVDVVILDVKMPSMDGIEVLRRIKSMGNKAEVIMMTGHGAAESVSEGRELGAFDYMLKPADFDELMEKIEAAKAKKDAGCAC